MTKKAMTMSNEGLAFLAGLEGIALSKYKDSVGVWTIGIGATRTEIPDIGKWPLTRKITVEEAFALLRQGIKKYERAINRNIAVDLQQHEFDALVSWCYNVGTGWAKKATVIKLLNKGVRGQRIYDALMMYKKPKEIIGRRKKEAKLLTTGAYSGNGKASIFPVSKRGYPVYSRGRTINVYRYLPSAETSPNDVEQPKPIVKKQTVTNYFKSLLDKWLKS